MEKEQVIQQIAALTPVIITVFDLVTERVVYINRDVWASLGYTKPEIEQLEDPLAALCHPEDISSLREDLARFKQLADGEVFELEHRMRRLDGEWSWWSSRIIPFERTEQGEVRQVVAATVDVTTRKQADESQLRAANEELRQEIAERERAEMESLAWRNALATELAAMTRLHEISTRLLASTELKPLLTEILTATIALQEADFGNIQLWDADTNSLKIVVRHGFWRDFLDYFVAVNDQASACGRALQVRERVIIEDVETDPGFAPYRMAAASAGFRAVQSTPLFSSSGDLLGMMSTYFSQPHRPSERDLRLTDLYAVHAAQMIERKQSENAVLRYQEELQKVNARLIEAQEMERKHLARELHDDFSQKLAALGIDIAAVAQRASGTPKELRDRLLEFPGQLAALAKDIHRISRQLHPAILDDLGLAAALKNECVAFSEHHGIPAEFDLDDIPQALPEDISLCLYRIAQECLRNIGKYANTATVRVTVDVVGDEIALKIADVGDGFDLDRTKGKGGLGLISMQERVRLVKGTFSVQSQPGKGTLVMVRVPMRGSQS